MCTISMRIINIDYIFHRSNDVLAKLENASFMDTDLGTDPLLIIASVDGEVSALEQFDCELMMMAAYMCITQYASQESDVIVQPGEIVSIDLYAIDQFGNYQEAVWSVEAPGLQAAVSHTALCKA